RRRTKHNKNPPTGRAVKSALILRRNTPRFQFRQRLERNPEIGGALRLDAEESAGGNADDAKRDSLDIEVLTEHGRIPGKAPRPEVVTKHRYLSVLRLI